MNKRRLLKLADLLESDSKNKKGMKFSIWAVGYAADYSSPFEPGLDCGTVACGMGLAAISGAFKRAGLGYRVEGGRIQTTWNNRKVNFERAAAALFDIHVNDADFLFTHNITIPSRGAAGERGLARQIRKFVEGKVTPPWRNEFTSA